MTHVLLSIGSNKNNPQQQIKTALANLNQRFEHVRMSYLYLTEPVGAVIQEPFINAAISLETHLSAEKLLNYLMEVEQQASRNRELEIPNGPRNLDIDIILFGDTILTEPALTIPHPRFRARRFVLEPLNEIAPESIDPVTRKRIHILLDACLDTSWVKPLEEELLPL